MTCLLYTSVSDYVRRQHSKRNVKVRERVVAEDNSEVPRRLYEIVALVSELHTYDEMCIRDSVWTVPELGSRLLPGS